MITCSFFTRLVYLLSISKGRNIFYSELKLQEYLKSGQALSIEEKAFIFAARSNMIDVHANFKIGKTDILCRKCQSEDETQQHILVCKALSDNCVLVISHIPEYEDLNSENPIKIANINKFKLLSIVQRQSPSAAINVNVNPTTLVDLE